MKFYASLKLAINSRYFYASIVYVIYSTAMLLINYAGTNGKNQIYLIFAVIHLIDAFLYAWSWEGYGFLTVEMIPEYLNIIGACLYLYSSTLYDDLYVTDDYSSEYSSSFGICRTIELTAAIVEVFAAFGWVYTWYLEFLKKLEQSGPLPHRGMSLFDPDLYANITIIVAAVCYLVYSIQISMDYSLYETDNMFEIGDIIYFANSIFYFVSALREYGFFEYIYDLTDYKVVLLKPSVDSSSLET